MIEHRPSTVPSGPGEIWVLGWMTELERRVRGPCVKASLVSFAQILFVWSRRFGSGADDLLGDDFIGDDFVGDAEERLTGLLVGDGGLRSIKTNGKSRLELDNLPSTSPTINYLYRQTYR
jgi:hypothetical protein